MVMLLVVVAIILYLSTRSWMSAMPKAGSAIKPHAANEDAPINPSLSDSLTPSEAPPVRPNLDQMQQKTAAHGEAVQDALSQTP